MKLVVTDQAFGNTRHEQAAALAGGAQFFEFQCRTEQETIEAVTGAQIILNNFAPMTYPVMQAMADQATIIRYGVGVDNVDLVAAKQLGIRVCNVPDYGIEEVADHAAAMTLTLARKLNQYDQGIRAGEWKIDRIVNGICSLRNSTVGLIGLGRIAKAYASRMAAFGCKLIAYDPYVTSEQAHIAQIKLASLEQVIASSQILSLHVPLSSETRHLIDAQALTQMPQGAILINCSRGGLIDEDALAQALIQGQLAGAGLDVFEQEPLAEHSALRTAPNLIMSPHAAFFSNTSVDTLQRLASEEALRSMRGEALRCALT
ncbi:C-terminal binding protein [Acinetobacter bereziniae]|uniref:C-terminal binding protein n=1 Tax=Acinetobacter bereziniae TaxID=106648 RepID=UPI001250A2ED|nr:C-terminal binding protein [Acinetobacter bereziniae]MCU4321495.1 C-terminal binding protein [Acinetobacter bereziniae]MCU4598618.1 C-terminal binding protein [Acinetobacter bereziniae]